MPLPVGTFARGNCCGCRPKIAHIHRFGVPVTYPSAIDLSAYQTAADGSERVFCHQDDLDVCVPDPVPDGGGNFTGSATRHLWYDITKYEGVFTSGSDYGTSGSGVTDPNAYLGADLVSDTYTISESGGSLTIQEVRTYHHDVFGDFTRTTTRVFSSERILAECAEECFAIYALMDDLIPPYPATPFEYSPWGGTRRDTGDVVISPDVQADNHGTPSPIAPKPHGHAGYYYARPCDDVYSSYGRDTVYFSGHKLTQDWTIAAITWYVHLDQLDVMGAVLSTGTLAPPLSSIEWYWVNTPQKSLWWASDSP